MKRVRIINAFYNISIADIKEEAESRSGKWTLSNVKIEYQFWKIYHLYKGHFFYQSE